MQEKKQPGKAVPLPEFKSSVTEILVANGRSFQPFVRTFSYTGENIAKSNLGTLIGVFEIDEMTEDCAYIVNFLASVAKKEYFNNPRRGAIESFEAALHKINLALSELVKHGNITWLGKFHGALGVLEKNNVHFSVTGQARILLLRNDSLSDISVGLASLESHIHPIKTFVEVSSGRLTLHDRILFTSPELLALFSLEELTKNAKRMNNAQFMQFLKTALINELDMAGTLLIDVDEEVFPANLKTDKKPAEKKSLERVSNIFSQKAFLPKKQSEAPSIENSFKKEDASETEQQEYVDTKTGHIYVQGVIHQESKKNHHLERISLYLEEFFDTKKFFVLTQGKWIRKGKKQSLLAVGFIGEEIHVFGRKIIRTIRKQWKKRPTAPPIGPISVSKETLPQKISLDSPVQEKHHDTPVSLPPEKTLFLAETTLGHDTTPQNHPPEEGLPSFIKEKLASFYQAATSSPKTEGGVPLFPSTLITEATRQTKSIMQFFVNRTRKTSWFSQLLLSKGFRVSRTIPAFLHKIFQRFVALPKNKKFVLVGSIVALHIIGATLGFFLASRPLPQNNSSLTVKETTSPSQPPTNALNIPSTGEILIALDTVPEHIITSVILNNEAYAITEKSIVTIPDKKSFPFPDNSKAVFATSMDDLRLIFIYTENGALYAWSPFSKTFVKNTLTLNEGSSVTGIDTYLTYLYVLESGSNQVYRFPRDDNGFGTSTPWLKEKFPIESASHLAVNENLFIATDSSTIKSFFRGRATSTFEIPPSGLELTDLYTHPGLANVYGLDRKHQKISIWNQDGKLLRELSHEKFSEGQSLSVNEKSGEIFISTGNSLLSYKLK